jgi:hypothetical protein
MFRYGASNLLETLRPSHSISDSLTTSGAQVVPDALAVHPDSETPPHQLP